MRRVADDLTPMVRRAWYPRKRLGTDKKVAEDEWHRLERHYNSYETHLRSLSPDQREQARLHGGLKLLPLVLETMDVIAQAKARAAALDIRDYPPEIRGDVALYKDSMTREDLGFNDVG